MTKTVRQMQIGRALQLHNEDLHGLTLLNPTPPQCVAMMKARWNGGPSGGRCSRKATYVTEDGKELCRDHAISWAAER